MTYINNMITDGLAFGIPLFIMAVGAIYSEKSGILYGNASNKLTLDVSARFTVPGISSIPIIGAVFTKVYPFEIIILVIAVFMWYLMYKSRYGMRLRACGENPQAAGEVYDKGKR